MKRLFALSCNTCAYRGCEEQLADPNWKSVQADLAHISGENPGAARYDDQQTDDERRAFENLILLCPNHHRLIDLLDPDSHPVQLLIDMKARHEDSCGGRAAASWATESDLERYALLLLTREPSTPGQTGTPSLVLQRGSGESYEAVNVGDADAFNVQVMIEDDKTRDAVILTDDSLGQLSPGGTWRALLHAQTMGNAGPHRVRLVWTDEMGQTFHGVFPVG